MFVLSLGRLPPLEEACRVHHVLLRIHSDQSKATLLPVQSRAREEAAVYRKVHRIQTRNV